MAGGRGGGRAELDRENAHFVLSETVISTLEQVSKDITVVSALSWYCTLVAVFLMQLE